MLSKGTLNAAKRLDMKHNVSIRVLDAVDGHLVSEHVGHNAATNSLLTGIGHYLMGDGVLNQKTILNTWIPRYISVGTMGLSNQYEDSDGCPSSIGAVQHKAGDSLVGVGEKTRKKLLDMYNTAHNTNIDDVEFVRNHTLSDEEAEIARYSDYITQCPGFGSDGYDGGLINDRDVFGLGPAFEDRTDKSHSVNCELVSNTYRRSQITYRDLIPEIQSECPETLDIVFSAYISTGALKQFREEGHEHIFITEVGLWANDYLRRDALDNVERARHAGDGLLAGYRICPPDKYNWDMSIKENRDILRKNIIKVKKNQVVQVIWKIQLGGIQQLTGLDEFYSNSALRWIILYPD